MTDIPNPLAFPVHSVELHPDWQGMTLRDLFAGQALVGAGTWIPDDGGCHLGHSNALKSRAVWAYRQADAMLAERAKVKP